VKGYFKDPEATAKAIDSEGFFNTGDLGRVNVATGDLILTGRSKDTVVLSNGENVEPQPLEDAILSGSELVEQVMVTCDEGGRRLVAILVVSLAGLKERGLVDENVVKNYQGLVDELNDPKYDQDSCLLASEQLETLQELLRKDKRVEEAIVGDLQACTGAKGGFMAWERVADCVLVVEPFAMSNCLLTQSFKVKRDAVEARYGKK